MSNGVLDPLGSTSTDGEVSIPGRGALRTRLFSAVSMLTLRPLSAILPAERRWSQWLSRNVVAAIMNAAGDSLHGVRVEHVRTKLPDGHEVRGEWVCAPGVVRAHKVVYLVHGSGFVLCSARTHRRLAAAVSRVTGLAVFSVDYRLAPQYRFPVAAQDVEAGWRWLTGAHGVSADRVVMMADSAGAHLVVDLLLQRSEQMPPAAVVLFSPLIDLTFERSAEREKIRRDPAIRAKDAARLVSHYTCGVDRDHRRLRLDVAGGLRMPPTLIQAGGAEMLCADARQLAEDIQAAGGDVELQEWPDQVHVFQALPRLTPAANQALEVVARFVGSALEGDANGPRQPLSPSVHYETQRSRQA